MATLHGPILDERACIEEENGAIKRLVCHYEIKDVAGATVQARMSDAYAELTAHSVIFGGTVAEFPDLMIVSRNLSMMRGQNSIWIAEITLMNRADLEGQGIFSSSSSMTSATTYTDYNGLPITTSYQFPANYGDWFPQCADWASNTMVQGCTVNTMLPTDELTATKLISCSHPTLYTDSWKARLNLTMWRGRPMGTVMCTNVTYKLVRKHKAGDGAGDRYLFQFSFQWLGRGHQPKVQFTDPNTGAPPSDLIYGIGYKPVYWFPYKDFNSLFPGGG